VICKAFFAPAGSSARYTAAGNCFGHVVTASTIRRTRLSEDCMLPAQAQSLLKMMQLIGALSGGRTVTQVALNWLMAKGAPPPRDAA
jgi:hypothetical protein